MTDWKKEWKPLAAITAVFLAFFYLPVGSSRFENAFLEAIYHRRPVVCNRYQIYRTDIEPCGFRTITFDGFLNHETIEHTQQVLHDAAFREEMVNHNYQIAQDNFSYEVLEAELRLIIERPQNIYRLLGRGMKYGKAEHRV